MTSHAEARKRVIWGVVFPAFGIILLWIAHGLKVGLDVWGNDWGVFPRTVQGLRGILFSPFLHADYQHLLSNTSALFVLGFVTINIYPRSAVRSLAVIWLIGGLILWVIGRPNYHIGASGLVYGMAAYLLAMGLLRWEPRAIAVALFVVFAYGSLWWGLLPYVPEMSWEGHLGGAIAGILAALLFVKREPIDQREPEATDEDTDLPYWLYEEEGDLKKPRLPSNSDST
jgi:membrane associated rhomboid family serine protease